VAPLTVPTGTITGQVVNASSGAVAGALVVAKLNAGQFVPQSITPAGQIVPQEVTTFSGADGSWSLSLVPNNNITPANTTYTISVQGMPDVQIVLLDTLSHPYMSLVTSPSGATLALAGQTVGPLNVTGLLDAQSNFTAHGPDPWFDVTESAFGAKGNSVADDTVAIQAAITACQNAGGGVVWFPAGNYRVSAPLAITVNNVYLRGGGPGASIITPLGTFAGVAVVNMTGVVNCGVDNLMIQGGPSTAFASNPAADGIRLNNSRSVRLRDLEIQYVNGFGVNCLSNATAATLWAQLRNVHCFQCNQGIHVLGHTNSGFNVGTFLTDCNVEQNSGGDAFLFEDAHDITVANLEGGNSNLSTGSTLHIKGACAAIYVNGFSLGTLTGSAPQANPTVLVESGANGTPNQIVFSAGIIEDGTPGASVTAGTQVIFRDTHFFSNATHGSSVSSTGDTLFDGCQFQTNGFTAGAGHFDAVVTSASGIVRFFACEFLTPVGTASGQVQSAINANGQTYCENCRFAGAGAFGGGGGGFPKLTRNNLGYNPVGGLAAPGVPASGTGLTNPFGVDALVTIVPGASTCAVTIGGTATGVVLASGGVGQSFRVPWNQTITLTYASLPTWTWIGE
jgi:hypothetical protein